VGSEMCIRDSRNIKVTKIKSDAKPRGKKD
jgi:hypothetical protein